MSAITTFLVIRVGLQDGVNPVEEVEKVIAVKKTCWFAKYGEPLSKGISARILEKKDVALSLVHKTLHGYQIRSYCINRIEVSPSLIVGTYPAYYDAQKNRVGAYIEISQFLEPQPLVDDLVVKSSLNKLPLALRGSMRGHFICRLR
jgi:hypothetical protein